MVMVMAEEEENALSIEPEFPKSRVKKIMTLDEDVKRVSSEALFLVSKSTELFLQLLAEKSAEVAIEKKRKTVKLEHIRIAVKRNRPICDFLLDSLPMPTETVKSDKPVVVADRPKSVPVGTRRIDQIFRKSEAQAQVEAEVEAQVEAEVEAQIEAQVEAQLEDEIEVQVAAQASEPVPEPMEES
ncbi:DNA polymerase epsilon subunit C [Trifolium pratense]|uniref:DNA polymerase epsilon subunit C n=1 Tax=Trifolium pratense TaxID=57577 RepID=UPI001E694336|nr:DNA polymerase epsilon subunit C [Trifolium pratense]